MSKHDSGQTGACSRITLKVKNKSLQVASTRLTKRSSHHDFSDTFPFQKVSVKHQQRNLIYVCFTKRKLKRFP